MSVLWWQTQLKYPLDADPRPIHTGGASFLGEEGKRSKQSEIVSNKVTGLPLRQVTTPTETDGIPKLPLEKLAVPKLSSLTGGKRRADENRSDADPESLKTDGELDAEKLAEQDNLCKEREELKNLMMAENSLATLAVAIGPNGMKVNALLDSGADNASLDTDAAAKCGFQPIETQIYSVKVGGGRVNTYEEVGVGFLRVENPDATYQSRCVVRTYPRPVGNLQPGVKRKKSLRI